jgi:hypothetical protein
MKKMPLISLAVSFVLTSCFLNQTPPPTPTDPVKQGNIQGDVFLQDVSGDSQSAAFFAQFGLITDSSSREYYRPRAGSVCQIKHRSKSDRAKVFHPISVGKVEIGLAGQSTLLPTDEDNNHVYTKQLAPGLPQTNYQVKVAGSDSMKGFVDNFALPEALTGVVVGGSDEDEEDSLKIKKGQPLNIKWNAASIPDDRNIMMIDVYSENTQEVIFAHCIAKESDLVRGNRGHLVIGADLTDQLPVYNGGQVFTARIQGKVRADADIQILGLRTNFQKANIE